MITLTLFTAIAKRLPTCVHPVLKHFINWFIDKLHSSIGKLGYTKPLPTDLIHKSLKWGQDKALFQDSFKTLAANSFPPHPPPHILSGVTHLINDSIQFLLQFQLSVGPYFFFKIVSAKSLCDTADRFPCRLPPLQRTILWPCEIPGLSLFLQGNAARQPQPARSPLLLLGRENCIVLQMFYHYSDLLKASQQ